MLAAIFVIQVPANISLAGGRFEEVRKAVRDKSDDDKKHKKAESCTFDCDDDDDGLFSEICWPFVVALIGAPFFIPHYLLGDELGDSAFFPRAPYDETPGYLIINPPSTEGLRGWAGRLTGQYGDNFDGISHGAGRLQLDSLSRFGFDGEWYGRWEDLPNGGSDEFWTGDANLTVRFAQNEYVEFHAGLGANWLADSEQTDFGFNFTYGADVFPVKPWVLSSSIDLGTLGHANLFHFRGTAGVLIDRAEIFAGYDLFRVGDINIDGLIAGIRFWF